MKLRIGFIMALVVLLRIYGHAQSDSMLCDANFRITEGIYLSYQDFRKNTPVTKDQIESKLNKELVDFFGKTLEPDQFSFVKNGEKNGASSKNVWGYYQNNVLHINYKGHFYRVPVFGSISYLMASIEVISPNYYYPTYGGIGGMSTMGGTVKTQEIRDFLINFYDGVVTPFSMDLAEQLISRDAAVYKEFKTLKRRQQKEQISRYIRKYNDSNPVYFLK